MIIVCTYLLRTEKTLCYIFLKKNIKNQQHQNKKKVSKVIIQQKKIIYFLQSQNVPCSSLLYHKKEPKITIFIF